MFSRTERKFKCTICDQYPNESFTVNSKTGNWCITVQDKQFVHVHYGDKLLSAEETITEAITVSFYGLGVLGTMDTPLFFGFDFTKVPQNKLMPREAVAFYEQLIRKPQVEMCIVVGLDAKWLHKKNLAVLTVDTVDEMNTQYNEWYKGQTN